ncbi:lipid A core-O-antigen ligase-like enyme [Desulfocurvibacter africanus PCS]|uniref:Lipid A core-O-antigen ligase-like enyme n=1 Tax=Desulfocurvibacter africanus PCS TaxID=1262666 RepID=M5PUL7_DESAF|nr:O-antigen ligase family protein [Desulfocurvibacter africanus]EMG37774.1 lipid A core-O-antigen ligase-like enyme [Desulfocurvibacter africanus PCS]
MHSRIGLGGIAVALVGLPAAAASLFLLAKQPVGLLALAPPVAVLVGALLCARPEYAYYLIVAFIPMTALRGLSEQYSSLTISKFAGLFLLVVVALRVLLGDRFEGRWRTGMWGLLGAFLVACVLSSLYSRWTELSFSAMKEVFTTFSFFGFTLLFVRPRDLGTTLPAVLVASSSFSSLLAVAGMLLNMSAFMVSGGSVAAEARAVGGENDPNFFAAMVLVCVPLLVHYIISAKRPLIRYGAGALLLLNAFALVITYSRSVLIMFAMVMVMLALEHVRRLRPRDVGIVVLALVIGGGVLAVKMADSNIWTRLKTLAAPQADPSLMRRWSYLDVGFKSFRENPVLGTGLSTFPLLYADSHYAAAFALNENDYERAAHNSYLEILVGTGLVGFLPYMAAVVGALWLFFRTSFRLRQGGTLDPSLVRSYAYAFISILSAFMFLSWPFHKYIWLFVGISVVAARAAAVGSSEGEPPTQGGKRIRGGTPPGMPRGRAFPEHSAGTGKVA